MAKLNQFRQNASAIQQGEWVRVAEEYDDLEIQTRGFTDAYFDAQAARQRRAAVGMGGDVSKLPSALKRSINLDCMIAHVLLTPPVRNLVDDDGEPVSADAFFSMLRDPNYASLLNACFIAAAQVGQRRADDVTEAVGNSEPSSPGSSTAKGKRAAS
jgi:hypothetical protein